MKKKLLALLLALTMVFALAACGGSNTEPAPAASAAASSAAASEAAASEAGNAAEAEVTYQPITDFEGELNDEMEEYKKSEIEFYSSAAQGKGSDGLDYILLLSSDKLPEVGGENCSAAIMKVNHETQSYEFASGELMAAPTANSTYVLYPYSGTLFNILPKDVSDTGFTMEIIEWEVTIPFIYVDLEQAATNEAGYTQTYTQVRDVPDAASETGNTADAYQPITDFEGELDEQAEWDRKSYLESYSSAAQGKGSDGLDYILLLGSDKLPEAGGENSTAFAVKVNHEEKNCAIDPGDLIVAPDDSHLYAIEGNGGYGFVFSVSEQNDTGFTMLKYDYNNKLVATIPFAYVDLEQAVTNAAGYMCTYERTAY